VVKATLFDWNNRKLNRNYEKKKQRTKIGEEAKGGRERIHPSSSEYLPEAVESLPRKRKV
jgi:hypothetical protein